MDLCSVCNAIEILDLPTFTGFNAYKNFHNTTTPSQLHQPTFKSLQLSSQSCALCALFVHELEKTSRISENLPPGLAVIRVGSSDFTTTGSDLPADDEPVMLTGLSREGWTNDKNQLYGVQVACGTLICEFGLFADDG